MTEVATRDVPLERLTQHDRDRAGFQRVEDVLDIAGVTDVVTGAEDLGGVDITSVQYQNANNSVRVSDEFMRAVENGTDPSPASIAETRQLLADKKVRVLVYNSQTVDKVTENIRENAENAGIPVVEVTETLPEGMDFVQWQTATAQSLADALNGAS